MKFTEALMAAITIDESGKDLDTIEILVGGEPTKVLFQAALSLGGDGHWERVTLADGTSGFGQEDVQFAFQEKLIKVTGRCVLEEEYHRAGHPELAAMMREARGA